MTLNPGQLSKVLKQDAAKDLGRKIKNGVAVADYEVKAKITKAIDAAFPDEGRATEAHIQQVAEKIDDILKVQKQEEETKVDTGKVVKDAWDEVKGRDAKMAQAVRMVITGTARGRTAPGTTGIKHIHVGGNAKLNLLFKDDLVLGIVNGHLDNKMPPTARSEADSVAGRVRQTTVDIQVVGNEVKKG